MPMSSLVPVFLLRPFEHVMFQVTLVFLLVSIEINIEIICSVFALPSCQQFFWCIVYFRRACVVTVFFVLHLGKVLHMRGNFQNNA